MTVCEFWHSMHSHTHMLGRVLQIKRYNIHPLRRERYLLSPSFPFLRHAPEQRRTIGHSLQQSFPLAALYKLHKARQKQVVQGVLLRCNVSMRKESPVKRLAVSMSVVHTTMSKHSCSLR